MVYGGGALGSLVAARLSNTYDISLIGRAEHVKAIQTDGLQVTGRTTCQSHSIRAYTKVGNEKPDVVLLTVKAYDTKYAIEKLKPLWNQSIFVSLQNGLGNEEILAGKAQKVLGAVINQGVTFSAPGEIYHAGEGETEIGLFQGATLDDATNIVEAFNIVGLKAKVVSDIREKLWAKVILNAAVNPLTGLLKKRTGELMGNPHLEAAVREIVQESVAIAKASDVVAEENSILDKIWEVAKATKDNKSSMLQDLERGRQTEIEAINGALVLKARAAGVPAPKNELLATMVRCAEQSK